MKKRKKIILRGSGTGGNHVTPNPDADNQQEENNMNELEESKSKFFSELKRLPFKTAKEFLEKRLSRTEGYDNIEDYINVLDRDLVTIKALTYAVKELIDFMGDVSLTPEDVAEDGDPEEGSDVSDESNELYPDEDLQPEDYTEAISDPDVDNIEEGEGGMRGFIAESVQHTTNMLNEILTRLRRVEERTEQHSEVLKNHEDTFGVHTRQIGELYHNIETTNKSIEEKVTDAISKHTPVTSRRIDVHQLNKPTVTLKDVFPKEFDEVLELAMAGMNIQLLGDTGAGKTWLATKLAEVLQRPYYSMSCTEGMSENEGKGWLLPIEAGGKFVHVPSGFIDAYEGGLDGKLAGVFNADEWDNTDPNVQVWFNKALSSDSFHLPLRYENPVVKKHKNFVWVACANTNGKGGSTNHSARNISDGAVRDRHLIGTVMLGYDPTVEKSLIEPLILEWGQTIRKAMKQLSITSDPCSTRFLLNATHMNKFFPKRWNLKHIEKKFFLSWEEDDVKRCREVLKKIIQVELEGVQ